MDHHGTHLLDSETALPAMHASSECLATLQAIVAERYPFQTVLLLGGGCCGGSQAQAVDKLIVNPQADALLGILPLPEPLPNTTLQAIEIYATPSAQLALQGARLMFDVAPVADGKVSDNFSLEAALGLQFVYQRHLPA